ncbi:MAG: hemerythrin domain-containing protein [Nitrospira sp.]|nr:hemerythrin domain-containing protein [Nitrospira sp.]
MPERTISSMFDEDHDRLDELFKSFHQLKRTDPAKAQQAFVDFKTGLQRHMVWEEDVLFPLWEKKTGMTEGGPTFVMRQEHREIMEGLDAIDRKVQAQNPESDQEEQAFMDLLERHNMTEEEVLYAAIDRAMSMDERETVFQAMNNIPEARYKTGSGAQRA